MKTNDIRRVLRCGRRWAGTRVDVFASPSRTPQTRLGIIVPKHGMRIVDRNRVKRRLREIGRRHVLGRLDAASTTFDILIRARRRAYFAAFPDLREDVLSAVEGACQPQS